MGVDAVLIAGPTASGKSATALAVAEALNGTLINCDSMQVYQELRILTARPPDADMARAPHLLYGHVSVKERYSAGRYLKDAQTALDQVRQSGRLPIFVGGTGLYFSVLTDGLSEIPLVPPHIQAAAQYQLHLIGPEAFHAKLQQRDPQTAARLRPSDSQRILRAYTVLEATGRSITDWQKDSGTPVLGGLTTRGFVLDPPRPILHPRIQQRYQTMLSEGVLEEAKALTGLDETLPAGKILGLRALWDQLEGRCDAGQTEQAVVIATRQYAKRQSTWFRNRMADWIWLIDHDLRNNIAQILTRLTR